MLKGSGELRLRDPPLRVGRDSDALGPEGQPGKTSPTQTPCCLTSVLCVKFAYKKNQCCH